jgi:hypothetical protein
MFSGENWVINVLLDRSLLSRCSLQLSDVISLVSFVGILFIICGCMSDSDIIVPPGSLLGQGSHEEAEWRVAVEPWPLVVWMAGFEPVAGSTMIVEFASSVS